MAFILTGVAIFRMYRRCKKNQEPEETGPTTEYDVMGQPVAPPVVDEHKPKANQRIQDINSIRESNITS